MSIVQRWRYDTGSATKTMISSISAPLSSDHVAYPLREGNSLIGVTSQFRPGRRGDGRVLTDDMVHIVQGFVFHLKGSASIHEQSIEVARVWEISCYWRRPSIVRFDELCRIRLASMSAERKLTCKRPLCFFQRYSVPSEVPQDPQL